MLIDPSGTERASFEVHVGTSGGRLEVLANGHVLAPERELNRVVEYDATGQVVWKADFPDPVAASHLPNGHTLVTGYMEPCAVELDRHGKKVWAAPGSLTIAMMQFACDFKDGLFAGFFDVPPRATPAQTRALPFDPQFRVTRAFRR